MSFKSMREDSSTESEGGEEPYQKKTKNGPSTSRRSNNPFVKPSMKKLKTSRESFLQDGPCFEAAPNLVMCIQCRWPSIRKSCNMFNIFCRFHAFRLLRLTKKGNLALAGFSDPHRHASQDDLKLWLPMPGNPPADLDVKTAKYLLTQVGEVFCDLLKQEKDAISIHMSDDKTIAWRRVIQGVQPMCDVCGTALFNFHWVCCKCGFIVCIDCYKGHKYGRDNILGDPVSDHLQLPWLLCTNGQAHKQESLMLTQLIAGDSLTMLGLRVHEASTTWNIQMHCGCPLASQTNQDQVKPTCVISEESGSSSNSNENRKCSVVGEVSVQCYDSGQNECVGVPGKVPVENDGFRIPIQKEKGRPPICMLRHVLSKPLYEEVPHSWSSKRKLLQLEDPNNTGNNKLFHNHWKRGQPVIVSNLTKHLDMDLWLPDSFVTEFGETKNDFLNIITGNIVPNQPMCTFWEGFENLSKRLTDERGNNMLLKLKDWPPGEGFAKMLPSRFNDLMKIIPLGEYSQQSGRLNLASRLPDYFVHPDLGPKMYSAYGPASNANKGTKNLHIHISDTVSVMVYVGIPSNGGNQEHVMKGAVWRIFAAKDANKIRDFLNGVAVKRGAKLGSHYDPIRDQSWYLDRTLRKELYESYRVKSYVIVQCLGDAIFIPAGAPHQVRNLHGCIKVTKGFVSPENVADSFHFIFKEARKFYYNRSNYEGELQLKSIIYHTIKDALSALATSNENITVTDIEEEETV